MGERRHRGLRAALPALLCAGLLAGCAEHAAPPAHENLFRTPALRQSMRNSAHLPENQKLGCFGTTLDTDHLIERGRIAPDGAIESFRCDTVDRIGDDEMIVSATMVAGGKSYPVQAELRLVERRRLPNGRIGHGWMLVRYLFDGKVVADHTRKR